MTPQKPPSYCQYVSTLPKDNLHRIYHDNAYGFPIDSDDELFERLILEINQAGLSWDTILKKQKNFQKAFDKFNIKKVAKYGKNERARLLADTGIIRNRLKIDATIYNAQVIMELQKEYGSFRKWIESHHPKSKDEWVKIFKKTFKFTGGEIVKEFLQSAGYLPNPHDTECKVHKQIIKSKPAWYNTSMAKTKKGIIEKVESVKAKKTMMRENLILKHPPEVKPKNKRAK